MPEALNTPKIFKKHSVWDKTTRWFHWINLLCVLTLSVLGLVILNAKVLGVSIDGKILLKTLHVYAGYVFAINLGWRLIWLFAGNVNSRWCAISPFYRGFFRELTRYLTPGSASVSPVYRGHNPLGRLMVLLLLALLLIQTGTGLILAGTDLYKAPFGGWIAQWVTGGDSAKLASLTPGSKAHVDPKSYDAMRAFRSPIVTLHLYSFYVLMVAGLMHIVGVVMAELRERSGLVSAMITGDKMIHGEPPDEPDTPPSDKEARDQ